MGNGSILDVWLMDSNGLISYKMVDTKLYSVMKVSIIDINVEFIIILQDDYEVLNGLVSQNRIASLKTE